MTRVLTHGTPGGYKRGCRCDDCRVAAGNSVLAWQHRNQALRRQPPAHGTLNGYLNYRCRCQECRDVYAAYQREYRAAR